MNINAKAMRWQEVIKRPSSLERDLILHSIAHENPSFRDGIKHSSISTAAPKKGDKFEVIGNSCNHNQRVGSVVEFREHYDSSSSGFHFIGGGSWYISWQDVKTYDSKKKKAV